MKFLVKKNLGVSFSKKNYLFVQNFEKQMSNKI